MLILGFWHEQSRYDRDNYVKINYENIIEKYKFNFQKREYQSLISSRFAYDYCSVMHYSLDAFAKVSHYLYISSISDFAIFPSLKNEGLKTIEPLRPFWWCKKIGKQERLSKWDWEKIKYLYNCRK